MKWIFYVVVFVYMFYRTVYGVKVLDNRINLDLNGVTDDDYIEVGETKTLICKGSNKNQKLQWINPNGQVVPRQPSQRVYTSQFQVQSMRTGPSLLLTINGTAVADSGIWMCKSGETSEEVSICVIDTLTFEGTPTEVVADEGRSFTLSCKANGNPEPRISWYRNEVEISDDDESEPKYRLMTKYNSEGIEGLLTIISLVSEDSGNYTCKAIQESHLADDCTASKSLNITLNVNHAPSFGEGDEKQKIYGKEAEIVFIRCEADGYPFPSYLWFKKDGEDLIKLSEDITVTSNHSGTASELQLKVTEDTYDNEYMCRATNTLGDGEKVFIILKPMKPEPPSEVELVSAENNNGLIFNITWEDEILFDIDEIVAQYLPTGQLKRRTKPRESDWKKARQALANKGDVEDFGTTAILSGLEKATEYWVRLRIKNSVGATKWSDAMKASTADNEENEDEKQEEVKEEEEEDIEANNSSGTSPSDEEQHESSVTDDDSLITSTTESPLPSDDSGKFYGLFFGVGAVLLIIACTFLMRMV
ncbi:limbic system-associated membrane protein-like [Choristoneura fumiferana]|uniref:limbic system-associated membrane protein-like n=1 Tax=Choristoneura fumiferana TaxID=7141 RepID=UPI003D15602E